MKRTTLIAGLMFACILQGLAPAYADDAMVEVEADPLEKALATLIPEAPKGATSWQTLSKTKILYNEKTGVVRPKFADEVKKLDGKEIHIVGFLFPLETTEKHAHFLLSALPPSCPFCLPAGPNYLLDVKAAKPIPFSYDPVHLKGTLRLLDASDDFQMFYRLEGAMVMR